MAYLHWTTYHNSIWIERFRLCQNNNNNNNNINTHILKHVAAHDLLSIVTKIVAS